MLSYLISFFITLADKNFSVGFHGKEVGTVSHMLIGQSYFMLV